MLVVMSRTAVEGLVKDGLWPGYTTELDRLNEIDKWLRWQQDPLQLPRDSTREHQYLEKLSHTPWLQLVVTTVAQCMYVDGYRTQLAADGEDPRPWLTWLRNGMRQRQTAIHRAALGYGYSFGTVLPGEVDGEPMSVMRGVSPRKMWAVYQDPANDDWPMYAMEVNPQGGKNLVRVYDEEVVHFAQVDGDGGKVEYIEYQEHGAPHPPVVRFTNQLDLDGRADGEVEPFVPAARRINKTAYDRLLAQHFNSWKIRTVAGMSRPDSEEGERLAKLKLRQEDLLVAEDPDTKFGTLPETSLTGFIEAWRADVEALAAVSQTPAHQLTGQLVNLSAEALAAARAALTQKVYERQQSFGRSHAQMIKLGAALEGDFDYAADVYGRVSWQDMEVRSIAQAVDALGKAATMLEIPKRALWQRIPGVEKADVTEWAQMAEQDDPVARMAATLDRQAQTDALDS